MKALMSAVVCAFALISSLPESLRAQDLTTGVTPPMSADDGVAYILAQKKKGIVYIDVMVPHQCIVTYAGIARNVDGKWQTVARVGGSDWLLGARMSYGDVKVLLPGDYVVQSMQCKFGNSNQIYNGPFAGFHVAAGEFVDVGVLSLDVKLEGLFGHAGTIHKSVERPSPDALKYVKTKLPHTFARMVTRSMSIIGPTTVAVKSCFGPACSH